MTSSLGDRFSYSYSIPCNPSGENFAFEYSSENTGPSGGTFRMKRLAAVNCLNSRSSARPLGDYDTISFSDFGTWSKNAADSPPRFATIPISTATNEPYAAIMVFQNPDDEQNVALSNANTRPALKPLP